jgi:hypothetical protein
MRAEDDRHRRMTAGEGASIAAEEEQERVVIGTKNPTVILRARDVAVVALDQPRHR